MKKDILLNLIKDYQAEVNKFMKRFKSEYNRMDLLRAWHDAYSHQVDQSSHPVDPV